MSQVTQRGRLILTNLGADLDGKKVPACHILLHYTDDLLPVPLFKLLHRKLASIC